MNEFAVLASAIEAGLSSLPPDTAKLILHAPESFDDLRAGQIAVAVRSMRQAGEPINFASVAEKNPQLIGFITTELALESLPLSSAEFYAEKCWQEYQVRRAKSVGAELSQALESQPAQAAAIIATARQALGAVTDEATGLAERLTARIYSPQVKLVEPETRFRLGSVPICTPGNLTTLCAQAKAGKSAAVGAMIASTFAAMETDCLGFASKNPHGFAVLHIDTEQCLYDHQQGVERARHRARAQAAPDWLRSYCVTGFSAPDVRQSIRILLEDAKKRFGGIHSVFMDGTADAVIDVNDPAESNCFVAELHDMAIRFDCPIISIIHVNPGSDFKTRGHLGSQLERKSETNLRLEKDADGVTVIYADKNRRAPIPKSTGPRFAWSDDHQMHLRVASQRTAKDEADNQAMQIEAEAVFSAVKNATIGYGQFVSGLERDAHVSKSTAKRRFSQMVQAQIIRKELTGFYSLNK